MAHHGLTNDQLLFLKLRAPMAYNKIVSKYPHLNLPYATWPAPTHGRPNLPSLSPASFPITNTFSSVRSIDTSPPGLIHSPLTPQLACQPASSLQPPRHPNSFRCTSEGTLSSQNILNNLRAAPSYPITTRFAYAFYHELDCRGLTFHSLEETTKKVYLKAFERFQKTVDLNKLSLNTFDTTLADYGQFLFEDDPRPCSRIQLERVSCFSLFAHPELKGTLHRTNRLTKSWKKLKPPSSASPLSKEIMLAFTHYFLSQNEKPAAICILLSWGALLRISETRHLYRRDVSLPTDLRAHSTNPNEIGIALHSTKTGPDQYAFIRDTTIVRLASWLLENMSSEAIVAPLRYDQFNDSLRSASAYFGLHGHNITSHSNLIGGALHQYMNNVPVADIAIAGRWSFIDSLNHYLKNGRKWLANLQLSKASHEKITSHCQRAKSIASLV